MAQKGNIALVLLIIVIIVGLIVGVYFISQNTGFLPNASNQMTIPYASPSAQPHISSSGQSSTTYQNPFNSPTPASNPFDNYQNPFDNL